MRGNGAGSVYQSPGRKLQWRATVTVGWTLDGRPVRRSRFAGSKAEAVLELDDMLKSRRAGRPVPDDRVTLKSWLPAWIDHRTDLRPMTVRTWRLAADHLLRRLGSVRVRRLTPTELETALADMPPGVAGVARVLLVTALRDAERDGLVDRNVARLSRAPKVVRSETLIPDAAQARALIAAAMGKDVGDEWRGTLGSHNGSDPRSTSGSHAVVERGARNGMAGAGDAEEVRDSRTRIRFPEAETTGQGGHRLGALIVMALGTGLRQGEMLGLTRECLDLDAGTARIEWALGLDGGELVLGRPKTANSRRVVPLPPFVVAALRAHRARQDAERLRAGAKWRDADGLVFTMPLGLPVHPNVARYTLDAISAKAGVGHVRFHSLRHVAGQITKEHASQEAAQALLGHASISTTDRYVAPSLDLARAATAALQEALG